MELQTCGNKIIEHYLEQELLLAELYLLFSNKYLAYSEFWESMVADEREHAAWIQHFSNSVQQGKINFAEGSVRSGAIASSISYITGIIEEFKKRSFDVVRSASIALDLEKSLIERNVFKHFEGDSHEVTSCLGALSQAQDEHVKKIAHFAASIREIAGK